MRKFILILGITFFAFLCISLSATVYYSYAPFGTDVTDRNDWWTNRNGSGDHPSIFNPFGGNNDTFTVQSGHNMTASAQWDVTGSDSKVVIENGGKITTGEYDHGIMLDIQSGGTYEITDTSYGMMEVGTWDANSTVILNNSGIYFEDGISYGNLTVQSGTADVTGSSGLTVRGTLTVAGGTFEGGQTTSHTNSYSNIVVNSGNFYGCTGSATVTHNISGNITVNGGYFRATDGSGGATYNVGGDVTINTGGWFYACYRSGTLDLPSTTWNITGSLTNSGYYYARNRAAGGYPYINLSGTGQTFKLGSFSSVEQGQHYITMTTGSSYTLTGDIYVSENYPIYLRGTLDASTYSINRNSYSTGDPSIQVYGYVKSAKTAGLAGLGTNYTCNLYNISRLYLQTGCTVEYYASGSQTVTPLTTYKTLIFTGGNKSLNGDATVADNITMNAPLSINSNGALSLNGSMSGNSAITGYGSLSILGTASALNLVPSEVTQLTLNRASGCYLTGSLTLTTLNLYNGTLYLGPQTMTIYGLMYISSGNGYLNGTSSSSIVVSGSANQLSLPALILGNLTVNRNQGCKLIGNVSVYTALNLQAGALDLNGNVLALYGALNKTSGYLTANTGTLQIQPGTTDVTLPSSFINSLAMNRTGRTCYMNGNFEANILSISNGTFAIGANELTVNTNFSVASGGVFQGGNTSSFYLKTGANIPAVTLNLFNFYAFGTAYLTGTMTVSSLQLAAGTVHLTNQTLSVNQSIIYANGSINGYAASSLYLSGSSAVPMNLPVFTVGNFYLNRTGTVTVTSTGNILSSLRLNSGSMNIATGGSLTFADNSTIYRSNGTLTGTPTFAGRVNVTYEADLITGAEIPSAAGVLELLVILANQTVTAGSDLEVGTKLTVMDDSVLDLGSYLLNLDADATIESGNGALIWGNAVQDIGSNGFDASALGIEIEPGVEITNFDATHQELSQTLPMGVSIERTWVLEGDFDGEQTVTFTWNSSADNGLDFDTYPAVVMLKSGSNWAPASDPINVSGMYPRQVTFQTSHFSEWTVTTEDQSLPVVLSSFSAVLTQQNYVQLNWITQSETNMLGFRIYRNTSENIADALNLNVLIPSTNTSTEQQYTYLDEDLSESGTYFYWLEALDLDGQMQMFGAVSVTITSQPDGPEVPPVIETALLQIFPNPFNPMLFIKANHKSDGILSVSIYDLMGRKIITLQDEYSTKGLKTLSWNGKDAAGRD
ncbi:MAG: hypothetical protein R6V77_07635, partial [Candidatus Cloacimonadaceae bacterium]